MIELQHVSFSYPDSTDGGLRDVTLTIPDGQCALLGGLIGKALLKKHFAKAGIA